MEEKTIEQEADVKSLPLEERIKLIGIPESDLKKYKEAKDVLAEKKYKDAVKNEKEIGDLIKKKLDSLDIKEVELHGVPLKVTYQDRSTMDEEKLVEMLEAKGLTDAIFNKKLPNVDLIPGLIAEGQLTMEELDSCKIPKLIPVLKLVKQKKEVTDIPEEVEEMLNTKTGKKGMF